ncbi:MAG: DUF389 domain-containing protein [Clostridia bacterium]|nr:DUF389 domain-containing protein [Clostridia bacterium]
MKNETITRAGTRLSERREKREAEAWDNLMKDLNPEEGETPMPASVEEALNGQFKLKDLIKQAFSLKGDTADYGVITSRLDSGGRVSGMNLSILFFAILIASIGLNTNSTAVIIGAMLISPLMGTIQLMGLGIATVNAQKFKKAIVGFLFQVTTAILTSTLYFLISPVKEATSEILGRTAPSVFDILIATFGGLAGIIALTRKDSTSNVIPGVAIATALMPPLCTCGFSIAGGHWTMLGGAFLLFIINTMFIMVATVTILMILRMPESANATPELRHRLQGGLIRNAIIVLVITILLTALAVWQNDGFTSSKILEMSTLIYE